ncbi:hypothetical protein, partial [Caballeronia arationis]|uniref:hypothetical protein n=1 Tax=Caballeronia arationis TaxID=1777142 RepID=UPI000AC03943
GGGCAAPTPQPEQKHPFETRHLYLAATPTFELSSNIAKQLTNKPREIETALCYAARYPWDAYAACPVHGCDGG